MKLSELVAKVPGVKFSGPELSLEISSLADDSRQVEPGALFASLPSSSGQNPDRARYEAQALAQGAVAVLRATEPRLAWAKICANYYGRPADKLKMAGVTGTNGKTTTAFLIKSILDDAGMHSAMLGTVGHYIGKRRLPAANTTPGSLELTRLLADAVKEKSVAAVMEVSSHALAQFRADGCSFDAAAFTNLTQDHLDYHKTMAAYMKAKERLFSLLKTGGAAVVNLDDPAWKAMVRVRKAGTRLISYSATGKKADLLARDIDFSARDTAFNLVWKEKKHAVTLPLPGRFNVSNALAAIGVAIGLGVELDAAIKALKKPQLPPGRFELVKGGQDFNVIVDYAHTPDALERLLKTAREITAGRLILVFGCGGDRDRGKRPLMGALGAKLADLCLITSDNPRSEDPEAIIEEILTGVPANRGEIQTVLNQPDRAKAIIRALRLAKKGDSVVIAGKGHEDYQIIGTARNHFSDQETARTALASLKAK
ncbi:MAG: UDP-N-acetylmuramoyl-L-alanyl-D-glutamate--2,6-diaminopimelate ligase [candidate division FCPU426 bacterium]